MRGSYRYKLILQACWFTADIEQVFIAADDYQADIIIQEYVSIYKIKHVYKYNRDAKKYIAIKTLEDKYVKAN